MHPRDKFKLLLWYSQALVLHASGTGKEAKEALVRDAKLLLGHVEAWAEECQYSVHELWRDIWKEHPKELAKVTESRRRKKGKLT
jgi:hypothetical protein